MSRIVFDDAAGDILEGVEWVARRGQFRVT